MKLCILITKGVFPRKHSLSKAKYDVFLESSNWSPIVFQEDEMRVTLRDSYSLFCTLLFSKTLKIFLLLSHNPH